MALMANSFFTKIFFLPTNSYKLIILIEILIFHFAQIFEFFDKSSKNKNSSIHYYFHMYRGCDFVFGNIVVTHLYTGTIHGYVWMKMAVFFTNNCIIFGLNCSHVHVLNITSTKKLNEISKSEGIRRYKFAYRYLN